MASQCTRLVEVDKLFFRDNVRTPECLQLPAMCESIRRHGFKTNHPLVVSEKKIDGETVLHVLVGNRRGLALVFLRDNEPDVYRQAVRDGKVSAIVHRGLTEEEEVDFRIDHSVDEDRVPLDDWSIYLAIQQLVKVGIDTQERIAMKLGLFKARGKGKGEPNRSYVQVRVNLARLPGFVQAEYQKLLTDGKDSTPVRLSDIAKLYKVYNNEYVNHPSADGPDFTEAWKDAMTPTADQTESDDPTSKELSPAEAVKRSQGAQSKALKQALLIVTKQSDGNLARVDESIVEGEVAMFTLANVEAFLGKEAFDKLVEDSARFNSVGDDTEIIDDSIPEEVTA